jgi:alpha-glucosidase
LDDTTTETIRMRRRTLPCLALFTVFSAVSFSPSGAIAQESPTIVKIVRIEPPEFGFYAKRTDYEGIPIKAHADVADDALVEARRRLETMLGRMPDVAANLVTEGVELHVIGKDQVTSDLPEHRHLKGKPFDGALDVDRRTRGLGGRLASCGEENLLRLPDDRYAGRDICIHEFAHAILAHGLSGDVRRRVAEQHRRSTDRGLWRTAYAATNDDEFFAELSMWYFGTRGDFGKIDPRPEPGRDWLRGYDPDAFCLLDDLYSGRVEVARLRLATLDPLPPGREGTLRSLSAEVPTSIQLVNRTPNEVQVFWLDYEGKRRRYGSIPPGGRDSRSTFSTHPWLLTDAEGEGLAIFVAGAEAGIGTLSPHPAASPHPIMP